jgi:hypothetical protein
MGDASSFRRHGLVVIILAWFGIIAVLLGWCR